MQTFVLVPQSPKKYYVHNDIFRYQDEVFHDNDTDTEIQEEVGKLFIADKIKVRTGSLAYSTCKLSLPRHNSANAY